jgi:predicted DNA-binding transcriptional regulator AlpA
MKRTVIDRYLNYGRLAKLLNLDPMTISSLVKKGDLPSPIEKDGQKVFLDRDIKNWLKDKN